VLAELAEDAPGSRVLASLLRQIDEPAEQLLPGPYRQVKVGAGESLSLLAARELGDPLMFYALARLNGIEVPARVPVGTVLRVPVNTETEGDQDEPPVGVVEAPSEVTVAEVESVAEYLARSGQNGQARAMLIGKLGEGEGAESTRALLARLTLEQAAEKRAGGEFVKAVEVIDEALEVLDAFPQHSNLVEARDDIRSEMLREEALRRRDGGDLVEAYRTAQKAANLDSGSGEAFILVDELREELVGSLHNEALIAWRDRNVDLAIRTWESLLAVVPDFEPARVYLERARRLRERLDEP
jgi:tetratricopeptide (TPR) repeat protein